MPDPLVAPLLYEVYARHWLAGFATTLATVPDRELDRLAALGVTHLWLMGVWPTGPRARADSTDRADLRAAYDAALPGWTLDDVIASPYAIAGHHVDPALGGDRELATLRGRLAARGIGLVLDFVANHLGLDHPWIAEHPEDFVGQAAPLPESFAVPTPDHQVRHVAHGKDPYFPAWTDTAQLDHRSARTRARVIDVLRSIAARCDGVRCDMAMLLLADVFERQWAQVPLAAGVPAATGELWAEAIAAVRATHPDFVFLAEAYWGLEQRLLDLGFTYTYDKTLYDLVVGEHASEVAGHLHRLGDQVARHAHFVENHDEPRIAARVDRERERAATTLVLGLPGLRLVHDGQLEGRRRPAQIRLARRADEPADPELAAMTTALFAGLAASAVGRGEPQLLVPARAWDDNPTATWFTVVQWQLPGTPGCDLVVINLAPHRAQCRVVLTIPGLAGRTWTLADRLGDERWTRAGTELAGPGLYLDLPAYGTQLFAVTRI